MPKRTIKELHELQQLSLSAKYDWCCQKIIEWVEEYGLDHVYVSYSGGKDSQVLLYIARRLFPTIKGMFVDTGLEFPETRKHVKKMENIDWVKPKYTFREVIDKYGYPFISKEVSEAVYGARKYLQAVAKEYNLDRQTDRQTCQITTSTESSEVLENIRKNGCLPEKIGGASSDTSSKQKNSLELEDTVINSKFLLEAIKIAEAKGIEEVAASGDSDKSQELSPQTTELIQTCIDNVRVQRMLGILPKKGKATMENIPSVPNRSQFACTKYQFFLDADVEISNKCCTCMKKEPAHRYSKQTGRMPITAQMASESRLRAQQWIINGCNGFDMKKPVSNPMAIWTEQDVLMFIKLEWKNWDDAISRVNMSVHNREQKLERRRARKYIKRNPVRFQLNPMYGDIVYDYDDGENIENQMTLADLDASLGIFDMKTPPLKTTKLKRTGCSLCGFGAHMKGDNRFLLLKESHPSVYKYAFRDWEEDQFWIDKESGETRCITIKGLGYKKVIDWINGNGGFDIKY